jgi:hypothetical protein
MATTLKQTSEPGGGRPRGVRGFVRAHKRLIEMLVIASVVLGVLAFLWFRPDKLFVDKTVGEALPTAPAAGGSPTAGSGAGAAGGVTVLSSGAFRDLEHPTKGTAKIVRLEDGSRLVRLEDFRTSSGPDVVVILSSTPATEDEWGAYDDGAFVNLGELRGNVGSQNYTIPANVDVSKYRSVVIWCRRFNVAFGAAPIS